MESKHSSLVQTIRLYLYWFKLEFLSLFQFKKRANIKNQRAVLLSFRLPPQFDSGTHRPLSFLKYAGNCGWSIFGVTNQNMDEEPNQAGLELSSALDDETPIYEATNEFTGSSWSTTPELDGDFRMALSLVKTALEKFKYQKPELIIASSPPFCFAVAGMFLSKVTGIPLVLDYRDEWTLCPFNFVSKTRLDKWFEKRCVKQANLITYTTESHMLSHRTAFSIDESKQALIYNGWDDSQPAPVVETDEDTNSSESLIISYIGRLSAHVDLVDFIEFIEQTYAEYLSSEKKITLRFIGPKTKSYEDYLNDLIKTNSTAIKVESIGLVKKSEALRLMDSSDYLLMMCNAELATYIPGKIYDYLSRKVPILAYGYPGEVSKILEDTNSGYFVENGDKFCMSKALTGKIPDLSNNPVLNNWLKQRTRKNQATLMFEMLSNRFSRRPNDN